MSVYLNPRDLSDALDRLARGGIRVLAGGTDLFPATQGRLLDGEVLDITGIDGLAGITASPEGLRIGAATPWAQIVRHDGPPALAALKQAAAEVGGRQIQTAGSIGGNLCNASPAADGVPPLLALGAEVELASTRGHRRLPLDRFLIGPRRTALLPDEMLVAVLIPAAALAGGSAFLKLGARSHLVISIAMVAVRLVIEQGRIAAAALAVGACGPVARRLPAVEAALLGLPVADAANAIRSEDLAAALTPIDDARASAAYRIEAATELLRRALARVSA